MTLESSRRAGRPAAVSSVAPVASGYERSLRPCSEPPIAPRRRSLIPIRVLSCSGGQDDLERGTETGPRAQPEAAVDARRARPDVLQALTGPVGLVLEPFAVVADEHDPVGAALAD